MNRRITLSVLLAAVAIAAVSMTTMAWFWDVESSTGNSMSSGTMDLVVANANASYTNGTSMTWTMSNMVPGVSKVTRQLHLRNIGSIEGDHVEFSFSFSIDEGANPESETNTSSAWGDMARMIQISSVEYDSWGLYDELVDANGNTWLDLEDLALPPNAGEGGRLDDLPAPPAGSASPESLSMTLKFRPEAGNDLQGDILTMVVTATLNQHASQ